MVYRCLLFIPVSIGSTTCRPFWILVWNLHWLQPASGEKTCSCCGGYIRLAVSSAERSYMKTKKVSLDDSFRVRNGKWGFIQSILPFWMSKGFKGFTNTETKNFLARALLQQVVSVLILDRGFNMRHVCSEPQTLCQSPPLVLIIPALSQAHPSFHVRLLGNNSMVPGLVGNELV